ncbi:DUF3192 domain-containing protein [Alteromonas sediminis]|uniref:DUF3192 domain-containing protein n=1 Tax=Alteromonas sediminis TaxID=2259342 RepID=A0A3N5Y5H2_9ALTE|nr:DUF3192 domain-containing protein [Alteromonas sediminis]RPJ68326.1 DUF3192 domain-containing protein [Alteromonas sediminis]
MKKHLVLIAALSAPLLLSGCVISVGDGDSGSYYGSDWQKREQNNRTHISNLETGMRYQDVTRKMGVADFNEMVQKNGVNRRVLYYRTQRLSDDGVTSKDECTPLVFENDVLVGWGNSAL